MAASAETRQRHAKQTSAAGSSYFLASDYML